MVASEIGRACKGGTSGGEQEAPIRRSLPERAPWNRQEAAPIATGSGDQREFQRTAGNVDDDFLDGAQVVTLEIHDAVALERIGGSHPIPFHGVERRNHRKFRAATLQPRAAGYVGDDHDELGGRDRLGEVHLEPLA